MARGVRQAGRVAARWPVLVAIAVALASAGGFSTALAAGSARADRVRVGPPPPLASAASAGAVAASLRLHLTVALKPRDPAGLAAYARAVSTPGSPLYHVYLTPHQFAVRFGATPTVVGTVERSLRAHGLTPGSVSVNRLGIAVSGSAAGVERAFALTLRRVAVPGGRRAVVASAAPALDAEIAPDVQAVIGLNGVSAPKPLLVRGSGHPAARAALHAAGDGPQPCAAASAAATAQNAYTADQVASAYGFDALYADGNQGEGQTIAIFELEPYDANDIRAYQDCYGTNASVSNVMIDGGPASGGPGSGEAALDIEQAIGLAPKATFLVYEGPNTGSNAPGSGPYDTLSAIVSQDRAHVVSMSWGQCEQLQGSSVLGAENTLFEEAAAQGQSVVSATGDEGSEDCNGTNGVADNELAVDDPGSQPFVTGVGGTTMISAGPPPTETVWNHQGATAGPLIGQGGAGGGGVSRAWKMPGYQSNAAGSLNLISRYSSGSPCRNSGGYCRQAPDVAVDADPARGYIFYWNGSGQASGMPQGWQAVGGTSAGAPLLAALLADADSSPACHGSAIGFANPALYAAASASYGTYFNDIGTGDNDFTAANGGLYPAAPGYDMASGLGSPRAGPLAAALCAGALRVINPGTQISTRGQAVSLAVLTTAARGAKLQFYATQLPPGLSISKSTGRVSGRPRRTGTWLVGIAAVDGNGSLRAAFFGWRIVAAPQVSHLALSGVAGRRPRLSFTVAAGRGAPALKTIVIRASGGLSFAPGRVTVTQPNGRRIAVSARPAGGRLRVVLALAAVRIRVTVAYGAIRSTAALASAVRRHRPPAVTVTVFTTDTFGHGMAARVRIRPRG